MLTDPHVTVIAADRGGLNIDGPVMPYPAHPPTANLASGAGLGPAELEELATAICEKRQAIALTPGSFNETILVPMPAARGDWCYRVSDYATAAVLAERWPALDEASKAAAAAPHDGPGTAAFDSLWTRSLGVAATIVTADGKLILPRRARAVDTLDRWTFSVNEFCTWSDVVDGSYCSLSSVRRGCWEELGIDPEAITAANTVFHSVLAHSYQSVEAVVLAHVTFGVDGPTAADILETAEHAVDGWEHDTIDLLDWNRAAVTEAIVARNWDTGRDAWLAQTIDVLQLP